MTPGTRVRLLHSVGFWPAGITGTVVALPERSLNGWEFGVRWDVDGRVSCWDADEVEVIEP